MKITVCDFCRAEGTISVEIGKENFDVCSSCLSELVRYCYRKHQKQPILVTEETFFRPLHGLSLRAMATRTGH